MVVADVPPARSVDGFFADFLHRSGSADRQNYVTALDTNTMTVEGIGVAILASDEFSQVAVQSASAGTSALSASLPPVAGGPNGSVAARGAPIDEHEFRASLSPDVQTAVASPESSGKRLA